MGREGAQSVRRPGPTSRSSATPVPRAERRTGSTLVRARLAREGLAIDRGRHPDAHPPRDADRKGCRRASRGEAFVADPPHGAYEKLDDRLLASPGYARRHGALARRVRYAERPAYTRNALPAWPTANSPARLPRHRPSTVHARATRRRHPPARPIAAGRSLNRLNGLGEGASSPASTSPSTPDRVRTKSAVWLARMAAPSATTIVDPFLAKDFYS